MSFLEELKRRNVVRMAVLYGVASWLLLQMTDVLSSLLPVPAWAGSLVFMLLVIGFPIMLIVSWVYEMTPEGLKREKDVDRSQSVTTATARKINILIVVLLVVAIGLVALDRLIPHESSVAESPAITAPDKTSAAESTSKVAQSAAAERSVAVLPFANRSAQEGDIFFVDGIHDDILTQLARIGSLTVISRTSVEKFRGTTQSMKEIGEALGVSAILEGGVQRAGDRVRINVQLIDADTDEHLWADTYDRELNTTNIFAIQSEVATAIATALKAALSPEEQKQLNTPQTGNMAALEAYFLGRQAMAKRTSASLAEAERQFQRALALDPDYALAYVSLADTYILQGIYSGLSSKESKDKAASLVEKALAINDRLGEAYVSKANIIDIRDSAAVETLYKKGIALAPGYVSGQQWYGSFLSGQGRLDEALAHLETAVRLDPLSGIVKVNLGGVLESLGRFDEARLQYESVIRIDPAFALAYSSLGDLNWTVYGRLDDAMLPYLKAAALDPGRPQYALNLAMLWFDLGDSGEARRWSTRIREMAGSGPYVHQAGIIEGVYSGDMAGTAGHAESALADDPLDSGGLWVLCRHDVQAGHAAAAVERYRAAFPALFKDPEPDVDRTNSFHAYSLAYALQAAGDHAAAGRLLDRSLAYIKTIKPESRVGSDRMFEVQVFALQGKKDQALDALRQAVDGGYRANWPVFLKHDPVLASLHDDPRYQAIIADLEADMAAQLKHVREMEANGELAPIPD